MRTTVLPHSPLPLPATPVPLSSFTRCCQPSRPFARRARASAHDAMRDHRCAATIRRARLRSCAASRRLAARGPAERAALRRVPGPAATRTGCQNRCVIGRLEKTVFDCPDPRALAAFYAAILGMRVNEDSDNWVVIGMEPGARQLAFQRVTDWTAPDWPDPRHPQQLHLDIRVQDVDAAEREVLALGARRLPGELEGRYRVFADPAGHPFCLVFGRHSAPSA